MFNFLSSYPSLFKEGKFAIAVRILNFTSTKIGREVEKLKRKKRAEKIMDLVEPVSIIKLEALSKLNELSELRKLFTNRDDLLDSVWDYIHLLRVSTLVQPPLTELLASIRK